MCNSAAWSTESTRRPRRDNSFSTSPLRSPNSSATSSASAPEPASNPPVRGGRLGGRPKAIDPKTFELAKDLYDANSGTVAEICGRLGIATRTFYRYLKNAREGAESS